MGDTANQGWSPEHSVILCMGKSSILYEISQIPNSIITSKLKIAIEKNSS
jgi:hypothetical protein